MKKIYVSPETVLQEIELTHVIAASGGAQTPGNFTFDASAEADNSADILSRNSGWFDDED